MAGKLKHSQNWQCVNPPRKIEVTRNTLRCISARPARRIPSTFSRTVRLCGCRIDARIAHCVGHQKKSRQIAAQPATGFDAQPPARSHNACGWPVYGQLCGRPNRSGQWQPNLSSPRFEPHFYWSVACFRRRSVPSRPLWRL